MRNGLRATVFTVVLAGVWVMPAFSFTEAIAASAVVAVGFGLAVRQYVIAVVPVVVLGAVGVVVQPVEGGLLLGVAIAVVYLLGVVVGRRRSQARRSRRNQSPALSG